MTGDLIIPENVTYIGQYAFNGCTNLKGSLTLSENLKTIANYAFYNCSGFTGNLVIPNSVTSIGDYAFYGCSGFKGSLILSENLSSVNSYTFYGCTGFSRNLVIPNSVTSIGTYAFNNCYGFKGSLTLSENLTSIKSYAFYNCYGFTGDLIIPNNVSSIESRAFYGCYGFKGSLTLSENLTTIGEYAFGYSSSTSMGFTGDLVIPNSVTSIGNYAFYNCRNFKGNLILSENLTSIGTYAFSSYGSSYPMGFTGSLTIPGKMTSISNYAFQYCSNFDGTLTLPASLTSIGSYSFANCSNFVEMVCLATTPPSAQSTSFSGDNFAIVYVPEESIDAYYEVSPWYNFWFMGLVKFEDIEVEIKDENENVLYSLIFNTTEDFTGVEVKLGQAPTAAVDLMIPESVWDPVQNFTYNVIEIADNAFKDCSYFTNIEMPITIKSIGENAFSGCSNVTKIISHRPTPPATGNNCFYGISDNTSLLIPANSINNYDILPWNRFDIIPMMVDYEYNVTNENGVKLYSLLFNMNDDYSTLRVKIGTKPTSTYKPALNIPEDYLGFPVTVIEDNAFKGCYYFSSLNIPNSVTYIGEYAFAGSSSGSSASTMSFTGELAIPANVTYIGDYAFYLCRNFTSLTFEENSKLEHIGEYAFAGYDYNYYYSNYYYPMSFNGNLNIPEYVTYIGDYAFYLCNNFTSLTFEENSKLEHIGEYAFAGRCDFRSDDWDSNYDGITDAHDYQLYDYSMKFTGELNIPNNITSIGNYAFYSCDDFTSLKFESDSKLDSIGDYAFAGYSDYHYYYDENNNENGISIVLPMKFTGDLIIPSSVTHIGKYAFRHCNFTGDLIIGDDSETSKSLIIEQYSFSGCSASGLKFGKNVTAIGDYAFAGEFHEDSEWDDNSYYTNASVVTTNFSGELVIPNSVTSIGNYAFYLCDKFTGLKFEENSKLETIGDYAFAGVVAEEYYYYNNNNNNNNSYQNYTPYSMNFTGELVIPNSVTSIGDHAFYLCDKFTGLKFEESSKLETIGDYAFGGYSNYNGDVFNMAFEEELVIPNSVISIGSHAFYLCNNFYMLKFEEGSKLQAIGDYAFAGYSWNGVVNMAFIGELKIPSSVTSIGNHAFEYCYDFSSLKFEENSKLQTIGNDAFCNCKGFTGELLIPKTVTSIGSYAFYHCTKFTKLRFEDNSKLETIGSYAFAGGWNENEKMNFADSLVLPANLKKIDYNAFQYNKNLATVTSLATTAPTLGTNVFANISDAEKTLIYPEGSVISYIENGWFNYFPMPDAMTISGKCGDNLTWEVNTGVGILKIEGTGDMYDYDYSNNIAPWRNVSKHLKKLVLEKGITSIGEYAFYDCDSIKGELVIPNSVTTIGYNAFCYCRGFNGTLTLSENLKTIESSTFCDCNFTGELNIPNGVTSIGESAFYSCDYFTGELVIPNSVTSIGNNAFENCSFSGTLYISGGLTRIEQYAFDGADFNKIVSFATTPADCNGEWEEYNDETYEYEWMSGPMPIFGKDYSNFPQIYVPASAVKAYQTAWSYYKDYIYTDGLPTFTKSGNYNVNTNWYILENGQRRYRLPNETEDVIINASLTLKDGHNFKVNSIMMGASGDLTLQEGGQLYCDNIYSDIKVEKSVEAHSNSGNTTWTTISSPFGKDINPSAVSSLTSGEYSLYRYDEPSAVWQNYKNSANNGFTTLEAGRGYLYSNSNDTKLVFEGTSNTNNVRYKLSKDSETLSGFHLIGNPYTHNITLDNLETLAYDDASDTLVITLSGNYWDSGTYIKIVSDDGSINEKYTSQTSYELAGISGKYLTISFIHDYSYSYNLYVTVKYKNGETIINNMRMSDSYGTYELLSFTTGTPKNLLAEGYYSLSNEGAWGAKLSADTEIKPCQGILVKTTEEGCLNIMSSAPQTRNVKKRSVSDVLAISVANDKYEDMAYVSFNGGVGLDKIAHENKNIPMLYIPGKETDYAIAMIDKNFEEIPLYFEAGVMGEYTISVSQIECGFDKLYLYDKVEDRTIDILNNDYTFFSTTADDPDRFVLKRINDVVLENFAYINNGNIVISNITGKGTINVTDVLGRSVLKCNCSDDEYSISTEQFTSGVYIIQKTDDNGVKTQKVIVD